MKLKVEYEAGLEQALHGLSLSYYKSDMPFEEYYTTEVRDKMFKLVSKLNLRAIKEGNFSHSKVLRQIHIWVLVTSTRSFWSQFDTYTVGVVRQSASTMHTLAKTNLSYSDFSENTDKTVIDTFLKLKESTNNIVTLRDNLPEGFLQTRMVNLNYAALQNILMQRGKHRYKTEWVEFERSLQNQLAYPELLKWSDDESNIFY